MKRFSFFRYLFLLIGILASIPNVNALWLGKSIEVKKYETKRTNPQITSNDIVSAFTGLYDEELDDEFSDDDADYCPKFTCGRPFIAYLLPVSIQKHTRYGYRATYLSTPLYLRNRNLRL
ncbi:MAG: hypothetical protein EBV19_04080 [Flavobacteriia bacterium]|nr:hypothetical protein [Flavobacteriia bacterium]